MKAKTLAAAIVAVASVSACAERVKVLEAQLADKDSLVAIAAKLGDISGNMAVASFVAMALSEPAAAQIEPYSGSSRLALYVDDSKTVKEDLAASLEPVSESAEPLPAGTIGKVRFTKEGIALGVRAGREALEEDASLAEKKEEIREILDVAADARAVEMSVAVTDRGIDVRASAFAEPGSRLEKLMSAKLSNRRPFATLGRDVLWADAVPAGSGSGGLSEVWEKVSPVLAKRGFDIKGFACRKSGGFVDFTLDVPALVAWALSDGKDATTKISDPSAFLAEINAVMPKGFRLDSPERVETLRVKGLAASATPDERIARTLPEANSVEFNSIGVFSYYGILKGIAEQVSAIPPASGIPAVKTALLMLPPADGAEIAAVTWNADGATHFLVRANPAEIKGMCAGAMAAIAAAKEFSGESASCDGGDDD